LGCGKYRESSKNQICLIVVAKLSDLLGKIIPLFDQYKLQQKVGLFGFQASCRVIGKEGSFYKGRLRGATKTKSRNEQWKKTRLR
jgi:hypothetical protein